MCPKLLDWSRIYKSLLSGSCGVPATVESFQQNSDIVRLYLIILILLLPFSGKKIYLTIRGERLTIVGGSKVTGRSALAAHNVKSR